MTKQLFEFRFASAYRFPALLFGVTPGTALVFLDSAKLAVRFGPWRLRTSRTNVVGGDLAGPFAYLKTAGPAHLSLADHGITFATNAEQAACLRFHEPVTVLDPTGHLRHPAVTLTVARPRALLAALKQTT